MLRVNDGLKKQLEDIALKSGVSASALARNSIAIAIMAPKKASLLQEIMDRIKHERDTELYGRSEKNDGDKEDNGQ